MQPQPPNDAYNDPLGLAAQQTPEAAEAFFKAKMREQFDSLMHTAATYNTPTGKKELERLRKATIEAPAWSIHNGKDRDERCDHAFAREGQNALVRDIENRIELAKKVKTPEDLHDLMMGGQ